MGKKYFNLLITESVEDYNKQDILSLIESGESERVEFKLSFDNEVIETLCAFANTKGGSVILGVSDNREIKGITKGKESTRKWVNNIKSTTDPYILPDVYNLDIEGYEIAVLTIPEFPVKPVSFRERYFKRVSNSNHKMSISEITDQHLKTFNTSWDFYPTPYKGIEDISYQKVEEFINTANRYREEPIQDNPEKVLKKHELIREGEVTNAAYLLFCKQEPNITTIELGHFQTETIIKDSKTVKQDLFSEVDTTLDFIKKHINKSIIIDSPTQRKEKWDYPDTALREMVINSIVHRDYTHPADSVLKIFNDRIEMYNPGKLPSGITIENLTTGDYVSRPRNKLIANMFREAGLVEKYGSGIKRIIDACSEHGIPKPEFKHESDGFMVILRTPQNTPQNAPQKNGVNRVLEYIKSNPSATRMEIADKTGLSPDTVKEYIKSLKDQARIKRHGSDRKGYWEAL